MSLPNKFCRLLHKQSVMNTDLHICAIGMQKYEKCNFLCRFFPVSCLKPVFWEAQTAHFTQFSAPAGFFYVYTIKSCKKYNFLIDFIGSLEYNRLALQKSVKSMVMR